MGLICDLWVRFVICGCGFVGDAVLVVVVSRFLSFFFFLVISDFVWSRLRKKIGDLGWWFFFFFFPAVDWWWWLCRGGCG